MLQPLSALQLPAYHPLAMLLCPHSTSRRPSPSSHPNTSRPSSRNSGRAPAQTDTPEQHARTLFVGDLPPGITNAELAAAFAGRGAVENVRLIGGKGFGFVRFGSREEAEAVVASSITGGLWKQGWGAVGFSRAEGNRV